jgi:hypothetical protein
MIAQLQIDFPKTKKTQRDRLLWLLSDLRWHSWEELEQATNGPRYGGRWGELLDEGYLGQTEPLNDGSTGNRYRLLSLTPGEPRKKMVRVTIDPSAVALFLESGNTAVLVPSIAEAYAKYVKNNGKVKK